MLAIKNNIMAANAARHLGKAYDSLAISVERLASGLRINSAKDDAAGLAVRELIRADIAVLQQGSRNASDGISMLQTMEGATAVMDANLIRMKELAEQAATGSYSDAQREIMHAEFAEMAAEIDRIAGATQFNAITMLNTSTGSVAIHVGTTETISIDKVDMTADGLGIETGEGNWDLTATSETTNGIGGLTSADAEYLTVKTTTAGDDLVLDLTFGSEEVIDTVTFVGASSAAISYTLQEVVDTFNEVSQNPDQMYDADGNRLGYDVAEVVEIADGNYGIRFTARSNDADNMTFKISTNAEDIDEITGFLGTQESGGTDLMLAAHDLWERWDEDSGDAGEWVNDSTGGAGAGLNILTVDAAVSALDTITLAITAKDEARAAFGYKMNRLESTISILDIQAENLMSAESRVSDVDVATEMATLTRTQVLSQAGISMLAQANAMPQMALTLLR